jgi:hypothetical protein
METLMSVEFMKVQKYRHKFLARFAKRLPLRFHMSLIVFATVGTGILTTWGLHSIHMENVAIRYPLTVLVAYGVFFLVLKLWLKYASYTLNLKTGNDLSPDLSNALPDFPLSDFTVAKPGDHLLDNFTGFRGGGSGGGGALRSFGEASPTSSGNGIGDIVADGAESVVSGLDDEAGIAVLVIMAILAMILAVIFGAGIYLIYEAPAILSETAFEFILAASLVRRTRSIVQADWVGSVLKRTWLPFALTMLLTLVAGLLIHAYFPDVTSIAALYSKVTALW